MNEPIERKCRVLVRWLWAYPDVAMRKQPNMMPHLQRHFWFEQIPFMFFHFRPLACVWRLGVGFIHDNLFLCTRHITQVCIASQHPKRQLSPRWRYRRRGWAAVSKWVENQLFNPVNVSTCPSYVTHDASWAGEGGLSQKVTQTGTVSYVPYPQSQQFSEWGFPYNLTTVHLWYSLFFPRHYWEY